MVIADAPDGGGGGEDSTSDGGGESGGGTGGTTSPDDPLRGPDGGTTGPDPSESRPDDGGDSSSDAGSSPAPPGGESAPDDSGDSDGTGGTRDPRDPLRGPDGGTTGPDPSSIPREAPDSPTRSTGGTRDPSDPLRGPDGTTTGPDPSRTPRDGRTTNGTTQSGGTRTPAGGGPTENEAEEDLGPMGDWRREYASQFDRFGPSDVVFRQEERPGGSFAEPYIPEATIRERLQQDVASQAEYVDPDDVVVEQTEGGQFRASVPNQRELFDEWRQSETGQRELARRSIAAESDALDPQDITIEQTEDGGYRVTEIRGQEIVDSQQTATVDFGQLGTTDGRSLPAGDVGQTTDPDFDAEAARGGGLDELQSETVDFFQDPYGETIGIGVEDLAGNTAEEIDDAETALSDRAGFDVGRTTTVTGQTLADRPLDSLVTGVATIRTGAAATASDAGEDAAAAGAVGATGTGTATGTGVMSALGATGTAAALPASATVLGARGIQEEDIRLPGAETAPTPAEDADEVTVPGEQFPSEIEPTDQDLTQPEIEVTGETSAGASTTRVPVGDGELYEPEVEVTGETEAGAGVTELPVGSGGGTAETPAGDAGESVVPGEYPTAGRDFPADPSREYVPGQQPDVGIEATTGITIGEQERERTGGNLFQRRDDRFRQERREILQGPDEEVLIGEEPGTDDGFLYERGGGFLFPGGEATGAELDAQQAPGIAETPQAELTPLTGTQAGQRPSPDVLFGSEPDEMLGQNTGQGMIPGQATQSGTAQASMQAIDQLFATPNQPGFANQTATGTEYPTETLPGFGYQNQQANRYPRRRRLPWPDIDSELDQEEAGQGSGFDRFWSRPVAESEDVFEDLFGR